MKDLIRKYLQENLQQADKIYFNSGKLPPEVKQKILAITNGDHFTKLVTDLVFYFARHNHTDDGVLRLAKDFHEYLTKYNKQVMPLPFELIQYGFDKPNEQFIATLYSSLKFRQQGADAMQKIPSVLLRNVRKEINTPHTNEYGYKIISDKLIDLANIIKHLPKKNEERYNQLIQKIGNSKNNLDKMIEVGHHFLNAFNENSGEIDPSEIIEKLDYLNAELVQDSRNILVIKINDNEAMENIGCMSTWCFARPNSEGWWDQYAQYGFVYVIFDFNKDPEDATFLMVLLPDSDVVYASTNVPLEELDIDSGYHYLKSIGVDVSKLNDEPEYRDDDEEEDDDDDEPAAPKRREPYKDPAQLSLFESKSFILNKLREKLHNQ